MGIKVRKGNQWVPVSGGGGEPIGTIIMWAGSSSDFPTGYLLCDGSALSRSEYSLLFAAIGTIHGAPNENDFNLPDLRERFIVGAGGDNSTVSGTSGYNVNATGGENFVTLTVNEMPAHTHNITTGGGNDSDGAHVVRSNNDTNTSNFVDAAKTRGEGESHENRPPYYALCYLIKVQNPRAIITTSPANTIIVQNNGSQVSSTAGVINFSTGLTASGSGSNVTVTSSGSNFQVFTQNGTWTKPSTGNFVLVTMWGGGGGGASSGSSSRGGGGGGGYAEYRIKMSDLGSTVSVTVGSGGAAGVAGGPSQFGSSVYLVGGGGAGRGTSSGTDDQVLSPGGTGGTVYGDGTTPTTGSFTQEDSGNVLTMPNTTGGGSDGMGGGSGGSGFQSGYFPHASKGGVTVYGGGGGGGYKDPTSFRGGIGSAGTSRIGGNGGNGNSDGLVPGGGGGGNGKSGARGEVWVLVI